jgi:Synergist-CTERM protein sorting domain-containing protein
MRHHRSCGCAPVLRAASVLVSSLLAIQSATADPVFDVEDLGTLPGDSASVAWGINDSGDVVGWSTGSGGARAFLYTDADGMVVLPGLPDRMRTIARDVNDAGVVVGSANAGGTDLGHAVMWIDGAVQDLGTLDTGAYSEAWGVNNLGEVVGWSYTSGGNGLTGVHAFLSTPQGGLLDLTPDSDNGYAHDINDAGQVTGYLTAAGGYHAFRWEQGMVDLGVLPDFAHTFGWALNASGQVAGNATSAAGDRERLFRSVEGGGLENLGGQGEHNAAYGINAAGTVVGARGESGKRAIIYTDAGGLEDLDALIDPSAGWVMLAAHDINDADQIVGYAFDNNSGRTHAVRLTPITGQSPVGPPRDRLDEPPFTAANDTGCSAAGGGGLALLVLGLPLALRRRRDR